MNLSDLFNLALDRKASEIHLAAGGAPRLRLAGDLVALDEPTEEGALMAEAFGPEDRSRLAAGLPTERTIIHGDMLFVGIAFRTAGDRVAATFRLLPKSVPSFERIMEGAEPFFQSLAERRRGLILVAGPVGSGKTTTALALTDRINAERAARILVVSDGASHVFENRKGLVSHIRIGQECESYERAFRIALGAGVDILTTDDLPTYEALRQALLLVDAGALVIANLHAPSPVEAIERLVASAGEEAPALRRSLAENLVAVTAQRLLPRVGGGWIPVYEWIQNGPRMREALLAGEDLAKVQAEDPGSRTLGPTVRDLYMSGRISLEEAFKAAPKEVGIVPASEEL